MIAVAPLKARVAGRLSLAQTTEERLIRLVQPRQHILQHLGMNVSVFWQPRFQIREFGLLLGRRSATARVSSRHRYAALTPRCTVCGNATRWHPLPVLGQASAAPCLMGRWALSWLPPLSVGGLNVNPLGLGKESYRKTHRIALRGDTVARLDGDKSDFVGFIKLDRRAFPHV